jgi:class II flagellar assembly regulator FliX
MASPAQAYQRTLDPRNPSRSARSGRVLGRAVARGSQLFELARLAARQRGKIDDPRLASLLDEIGLRAQVELAKLAAAF